MHVTALGLKGLVIVTEHAQTATTTHFAAIHCYNDEFPNFAGAPLLSCGITLPLLAMWFCMGYTEDDYGSGKRLRNKGQTRR